MFTSSSNRVASILICGPSEWTETFMFEAAAHWTKRGHRVIYVTPNRIDSLPRNYHDGTRPTIDSYQLIKFMYLPDYRNLMEQLLELDTHAALPSALLIDKLETYTRTASNIAPDDGQLLVAKTCSIIIDAMSACSRILNKTVHVCASIRSNAVGNAHLMYFDHIWNLTVDPEDPLEPDVEVVTLQKAPFTISDRLFKFRSLNDGTVVLKQILRQALKDGSRRG